MCLYICADMHICMHAGKYVLVCVLVCIHAQAFTCESHLVLSSLEVSLEALDEMVREDERHRHIDGGHVTQ